MKAKAPYEHVNNIFQQKYRWEDLNEMDRKSFAPFIINRFISMSMDYIGIINELQVYTANFLPAKYVHDLYVDIFPKHKMFNKYIKSSKDTKFNSDLVEMMRNTEEFSSDEVESYLTLLVHQDSFDRIITEYLRMYGKTDSEITKMLKVEK